MDNIDERLQEQVQPYLNKPSEVRWSDRAVDTTAVWNFCEAVEDGNPVYWDPEAAAASRFGRMISPPHALMALNMGAWWLPPYLQELKEKRIADAGASNFTQTLDVVRSFGFVVPTNVSRIEEYLQPYGPGDGRFGVTEQVTHVGPAKQTRVGRGVFVTTQLDFITEKSDGLVASAKNVLLMYEGTAPS